VRPTTNHRKVRAVLIYIRALSARERIKEIGAIRWALRA